MYERGVSGTSLDDVRKAAAVSGSQISHYFADKQDLIRQVVEARTNFVVAFHDQPKLGDLDRLQSLRAWADLCWQQAGPDYLRKGCVYGSLTGELLEADESDPRRSGRRIRQLAVAVRGRSVHRCGSVVI